MVEVKRRKSGPKPKPFECPESVFWYLVGLIAADGCLSKDGRHVDITSKDGEHLRQVTGAAGLRCGIAKKRSSLGRSAYRIQIASRTLCDRLLAVGLTPNKSLTLGPIDVPDGYFRDFLRGVIDGDGNIRRWKHPSNGCEQWVLRITSAAEEFVSWLDKTTERLWGVQGGLHREDLSEARFHTKYTLKYGKLAAKVILGRCYYAGALALGRKEEIAEKCNAASVGWAKSKTVVGTSEFEKWKYVRSNYAAGLS